MQKIRRTAVAAAGLGAALFVYCTVYLAYSPLFAFLHPDSHPCSVDFTGNQSTSDTDRVKHQVDWSMAELICLGMQYLGSKGAVLQEIMRADISSFEVGGTHYSFAFPHERRERLFYPQYKIMNVDQDWDQREEISRQNVEHCRKLSEDGEIGPDCHWARDYGLGIPMIGKQLPADIHGVMIDTGLHVGTETVYLAKQFPNVHIYAVEPHPTNCFYVLWNLLRNGIRMDRVTILHRTLAAHQGDAEIMDLNTHSGSTEVIMYSPAADHLFCSDLCRAVSLTTTGSLRLSRAVGSRVFLFSQSLFLRLLNAAGKSEVLKRSCF